MFISLAYIFGFNLILGNFYHYLIISLNTILDMGNEAYKFYGRVTQPSLYLGLFPVNYSLITVGTVDRLS